VDDENARKLNILSAASGLSKSIYLYLIAVLPDTLESHCSILVTHYHWLKMKLTRNVLQLVT